MEWQNLYSNKRIGSQNTTPRDEIRGDYMRDYDRVIFSSHFRKLQNKTQVFPLPGAVFVHNRLTHSLEVASVGRSLGKAVGDRLAAKYHDVFSQNNIDFYRFELSDVIQTACLAHDIGNPPFGHFGEEAIRAFFIDYFFKKEVNISKNQKLDLEKFEGNANAFRVLTTLFMQAGLKLTYTSLVSIIKYPADSSSGFDKSLLASKKTGFFDAEIELYKNITDELGIPSLTADKNLYARHPFVFLVEAADDICYRIIDLEDAFRLNVISFQEAFELLMPLFENDESKKYIIDKLPEIKDQNRKLSLLRAMLINLLTKKCTEAFLENEELLLKGQLNKPLIDLIDNYSINVLKKIDDFSFNKIYNHTSVIEKELAGYNVIYGLLTDLIGALDDDKSAKSKKILRLIPAEYNFEVTGNAYQDYLKIVDFVSGMTDVFAMDLYRKIKGIQAPGFN
jgi:dGTPase